MRSKDLYVLIIIAVVTGIALWVNFAPGDPPRFLGRDVSIRRGLDLQGGIQVLLQATDPEADPEEIRTAATVIERRVNGLGVGETVVQLAGNDRIIVELPGVSDPEQAVETLRGTGQLEFIDSQGQFFQQGQIIRTTGNPEPQQLQATTPVSDTDALGDTAPVSGTAGLTETNPLAASVPETVFSSITQGSDLDTTQVQPAFSQGGTVGSEPAVSFAFRGRSASALASFTAANVGNPMCIVLDSVVVSCPVINSPLTDGSGIITSGSTEERDRLLNQLKFGALPVSLQVETSRTVSATLGQDSVNRSVLAGVIGLSIVALYMILFYRLPGVLAALALLIYTAISFAIYRLIPITLTLAGIAGFILSVGLAVDANVLIFARLREEYRRRQAFRPALEAGFEEAWPAIRDSSVATLITSFILFLFGNSFGVSIIQGFALTLGLGMLISLFTAVVITRTFLRLLAPFFNEKNLWLFGLDRSQPKRKLVDVDPDPMPEIV